MTNLTKYQLLMMARNERRGKQAENMRRLFNNAIWMFENNKVAEAKALEAKAFAILEAMQKDRAKTIGLAFTLVETDHIHDAEGIRVRVGDDVSCHNAGAMDVGLVLEITDVDVLIEWSSAHGIRRVSKDTFENYCRVTIA